MDRADREESEVTEAKASRIKEKIAGLRRQMQFLKDMERQVKAAPGQQVSLTDPDARSMATSGRGTGIVGYNVQTAVDTQARRDDMNHYRQPDRLFFLPAQSPVYAGQTEAGQALATRRRPGRDASLA